MRPYVFSDLIQIAFVAFFIGVVGLRPRSVREWRLSNHLYEICEINVKHK
jgi:hypothetical protein